MPNNTIKSAIVTGASSGIGRELVRQLVAHPSLPDIRIVATARRLDRLEELVRELPPGKVLPFAADLGQPQDRANLWNWSCETLGSVDLLVNNAGLGAYGPFQSMDEAQIRQVFAVDVEAVIDLTARALKTMVPAGSGQIVQISSVLGEVGLPYSAAYVAAKHAVNGLVKSIRYEIAGSGVHVWAACPGQTASEFRQTAGQGYAPSQGRGTEPTEKVVAGIVRGIVRGYPRALMYPTWNPWLFAQIARISPKLWDLIMVRYGRQFARDDLGPNSS